VLAKLVGLEVHLRLEHDKLLLETLAVRAHVVLLLEVVLKRVVVQVVVRLARVATVAEEATLVLVPAVLVQFVAVVETGAAKAAQRVAPEAGLVDGAGLVVAVAHVLGELLVGKHVVLVGKHLLVASAQVAHFLVVLALDVAVQVLPAETGKVAFGVGAVIAEQQDGVAYDVLAGIPNANVIVGASNLGVGVFLETLRCVVGENDKRGGCLATSQRSSLSMARIRYLPGNEGSRCSCIAPSSAGRRGGM
jgi:hypothetical protein